MSDLATVPPEGTSATFLGAAFVNNLTGMDADFAVIGVPFGVPYGIRQIHHGATDAPRAVRERGFKYSRMTTHHDFDLGCTFADLGLRIVDCGDVTADPRDFDGSASRSIATIRKIVEHNITPIVLGGDDSVSALAIGALEPRAPVTVVQIDAHIDYRDEVNGIRHGYSSPMRRAAEMPWVERIIHVGTRGVGSARPQDVADTLARGNSIVTAREVSQRGIDAVLRHIPAGSNVHVTLDCDGLDPAVMPGTSAPMPGGLSYTDTAGLFMALGQHGRVVGFNLAEHYPALDVNGITAITITRLIMALMAGSKLDRVPPAPFQQKT